MKRKYENRVLVLLLIMVTVIYIAAIIAGYYLI